MFGHELVFYSSEDFATNICIYLYLSLSVTWHRNNVNANHEKVEYFGIRKKFYSQFRENYSVMFTILAPLYHNMNRENTQEFSFSFQPSFQIYISAELKVDLTDVESFAQLLEKEKMFYCFVVAKTLTSQSLFSKTFSESSIE